MSIWKSEDRPNKCCARSIVTSLPERKGWRLALHGSDASVTPMYNKSEEWMYDEAAKERRPGKSREKEG